MKKPSVPPTPLSAAAVECTRIAKRLGGPTAFARTVSAHEATVRSWLTGRAKPTGAARATIAGVHGIRSKDWDREAEPGETPAKLVKRRELPPVDLKPLPADASAKDRAEQQLLALDQHIARAHAAGVTYREFASLEAARTSAIRLLSRLSGELEVTESAILRSPAWARLMNALREEVMLTGDPDFSSRITCRIEKLAEEGK